MNQKTLKELAFSIIGDDEIKDNIEKVQQMIEVAPGNKGGAKMLKEYYNNCKYI